MGLCVWVGATLEPLLYLGEWCRNAVAVPQGIRQGGLDQIPGVPACSMQDIMSSVRRNISEDAG